MFMMSSERLLGSTLFIVCLAISLHQTCMMITSGLSSTNVASTKCFNLFIVEPWKTLK